jgi:hypothetical protein
MKPLCTLVALIGILGYSASDAVAQTAAPNYQPLPWTGPAPAQAIQASYQDSVPTPAVPDAAPTPTENGATSGFLNEAQSPCIEPCQTCDPCNRKFFAFAYGLAMTRVRAPAYWITNTADDFFNFKLNTQNAGADWAGGGGITLGWACCGIGSPTLTFTYWGLGPMQGFASVSDTTGNPATALSSTIDWSGVTINGTAATTFFDNAQQQAVWRTDRVDNLEFNFQSSTYMVGSFQISGLAGFRYFRFTENLTYGSASFGNSFTSNGGADAGYLSINCANNLYGGQVGSVISSVFTPRLIGYAVPKVGIYGNQMNNLVQLYTGDTVSTPETAYQPHKTDVAVLAELDLALSWAFNPNWRLNFGYRIVGVNNVSLGDNQFAAYNHVEQNGSLILHGAFVGLLWMF